MIWWIISVITYLTGFPSGHTSHGMELGCPTVANWFFCSSCPWPVGTSVSIQSFPLLRQWRGIPEGWVSQELQSFPHTSPLCLTTLVSWPSQQPQNHLPVLPALCLRPQCATCQCRMLFSSFFPVDLAISLLEKAQRLINPGVQDLS